MRYLILIVLVAGLAGGALALPPELSPGGVSVPAKDDSHVGTAPARDGREGGEDIATAIPILAMPFQDTGATCDNLDDYDEVCPYEDSTSPDVVYSFVAGAEGMAWVDLCGSEYDTKVYLYDADLNLVGCNDDYYFDDVCGQYTSFLSSFVDADQTYYIVVDGYGGDCGTYNLNVDVIPSPQVLCPPGALEEGEPPLEDEYEDQHNPGCGGLPPVWQAIWAQEDNCATMCAVSGWYDYQDMDFRDTDWFEVLAVGDQIDWTLISEWEVDMLVIAPDCAELELLYTAFVPFLEPVTLSFPTTPGEVFWLWVGPTSFDGPLDEFDYLMDICGIQSETVPAERQTWGGLKNLYR